MYIPKSQITIKVAVEGELQFKHSKKSFIGEYLETSKGKLYEGTNSLSVGKELIPIEPPTNKTPFKSSKDVKKFNIHKKNIKKFLSNTITIPSMKKYPSQDDYVKGYFIRYFSRRINSTGYQEIGEDVYNSISKKEKKYDHNLYEIGKINWNLTGNVFKNNTLALKELEQYFPNISYLFPIFDEFAREPFENQEDLHTEGGELYYSDSTEYIGAYHIHNTRGPMQGAYHTEQTHLQLYYTDELPTPPNISYEEFMAGYPPTTNSQPELPIKDDVNPIHQFVEVVDPVDPTYVGESYDCIVGWGPTPPGYIGMTNQDGLAPVSSACVDPGDGLGMYSINDTDGGAGCMFSWDNNYCSTCTIHITEMCMGNYNTTGGVTLTPVGSTCPCGSYNGTLYYNESCC